MAIVKLESVPKWHYNLNILAKMAYYSLNNMPKIGVYMTLREYRQQYNLSLKDASNISNIPLRTYIRYEQNENYGSKLKRKAIEEAIKDKYEIREDKGILELKTIENICNSVFKKHLGEVDFCYLFGSYAKGYARETSDVDLLVSTNLSGIKFVGLIEELRIALNKRVDLIRLKDISGNLDLLKEIMMDGQKIYEQH